MHNYIEWILKRQVVDACPPRKNAQFDKFLIAIAIEDLCLECWKGALFKRQNKSVLLERLYECEVLR